MAEILVSDNFDNIENWKTDIPKGRPEEQRISFQDGKAISINNGCFMLLNKDIEGEVFLEIGVSAEQIDQEGYQNHEHWDFNIKWMHNLNIILLFDKNGYDRIGYVESPLGIMDVNKIIFNEMSSTTKNGKIQLSIFEKGFQAKYLDSVGNEISISNSDIDNPYSKFLLLGLAAFSNSPRMVDNLKITRL